MCETGGLPYVRAGRYNQVQRRGGNILDRRGDRRRYRKAGNARPRERNVLLFLVIIASLVTVIVWRASEPPAPQTGKPSLVPTVSLTATQQSGIIPDQPNGLAQLLGPAIDRLIAQYQAQGIDHVGLVIEDDRSGNTIERNADDEFAAASLYKLFVLWRTQVEIRQGKLRDDSELMLTARNDDSAEDGYSIGAYGDTIAVEDLRRLMITASNNTAAQVLGQYFGWGTVDQLLRAHGFTATMVSGQPSTTPREVTRFFEGVRNQNLDPLLTPADYALMLSLLKDQEVNTKLSTGFPDGTVFAHKTGDIQGAHHDAGVIFLPDGRTISVTVLTSGDYDASVQLQHDLAALLWQGLGT